MLRAIYLWATFWALLLHASAGFAKSYVYVSLAGENRIAIYGLDEQTGALTLTGGVQVSGGPGALAVGPSQRFLFASIRSVGNLASFRINPQNGNLALINEVAAGADPAYVMPDKQGRFLLSAYYRAGKVAVHAIGEDGTISNQALQSITTDEKAHAIQTDHSNRFAFVPHTGPNAIYQFKFDPASGRLAPNQQLVLKTPDKSGPRHIWFHPRKSVAYVSDEQGNSVTGYMLDSKSGTLQPFQTVASLPAGYRERNSTADIEVHPSGRFVFIANRGHDSIAAYSVDEDSAGLSLIGHTPTEKTPRSFNIDPSGRFLIAAGQSSNKLAVFAIDKDQGLLSRRTTYQAGKRPWWVLVVRFKG